VQQVFNGTLDRGYNRAVAFDLFHAIDPPTDDTSPPLGLLSTADITTRILEGQAASDRSAQDKGMRLGYMGHLTLIAEEVCKFGNRHPPESLEQVVHDSVNRPEWIQYVEGTLTETRDKDNAVLGGVRPENAIGMRQNAGLGGGGGGFSSNTQSALASAGIGSGIAAQDSLALSEGTVGQSFEINSGTMLSGFGDGDDDDDDEEMGEDEVGREEEDRRRRQAAMREAFSEDENVGELSFEDVDMDYR
jgi:SIT4-associating protein SAP185/190